MKFNNPLCPKCGCPPRSILGTFQVRLGVTQTRAPNGSVGQEFTRTGEQRVGKPVGQQPLTLECGGGHQWMTEEVK